jgi:hypothetical protein
LLNISDERKMSGALDSIIRDALSEISDLPLKVTDERWMQKLDDVEQPAKRKIATS